ncbi:MAG TPA: nucleoside triphosphate pyrophosphohydrolase family protein [Herpetosiphonaceae bacterium]
MNFDEYQDSARRTLSAALDRRERLAMTALGLVGEAGECSEAIKKHLFHGHPLDQAALAKELGDVLWYVAMLADACGLDLESIAAQNITKLRARYPEGFSAQASIERDET